MGTHLPTGRTNCSNDYNKSTVQEDLQLEMIIRTSSLSKWRSPNGGGTGLMGARLPGWKYRINFSLIEVPNMIIRSSSLSVRRVRRMNWSYGCTIPKKQTSEWIVTTKSSKNSFSIIHITSYLTAASQHLKPSAGVILSRSLAHVEEFFNQMLQSINSCFKRVI